MQKQTASLHFFAHFLCAVLILAWSSFSGTAIANTDDKHGQVLQQKLNLLDSMINRGSTSKKVRNSDNEEAKRLLRQAEDLYALARENIHNGNLDETGKIINEAIRAISSAGAKAKGKKGTTPAERSRYKELQNVIDSLLESVDLTFENPIDLEQINEMRQQALQHTKKDHYSKAIKVLDNAYQIIATAISENVRDKTIVYSLDFKDSRDEYEYEHRRYTGNRELVTTMLNERQETPTRKLIVRYSELADKTLKHAEQLASNNDHDEALKVVEQANKDLSRAMGMLGLRF